MGVGGIFFLEKVKKVKKMRWAMVETQALRLYNFMEALGDANIDSVEMLRIQRS